MSTNRVHKGVGRNASDILCAIEDRIMQSLARGLSTEQRTSRLDELRARAQEIVKVEVQVDLINPMHLEGYHGDKRAETAHIKLPRSLINRHFSGGASNDAGFIRNKQTGDWDAIISDYDRSQWWGNSEGRFLQVAAAHESVEAAGWNNYTVTVEEDQEGKIQIYCDSND
jgi:hypothetical protein